MGNGPHKEGLWNSPGVPLVVYSSTGIPKEPVWGMDLKRRPNLWNPLEFLYLSGSLFKRNRGILLNCKLRNEFSSWVMHIAQWNYNFTQMINFFIRTVEQFSFTNVKIHINAHEQNQFHPNYLLIIY